ncbi:MAG: MlaD family protein [Candidatus Dormibacteria bacterium]
MRSRWNWVIVAVYVALSSSILSFMAVKMGGPCLSVPFTAPACRTVSVEFKDASGLLHSNDLRLAGIQVGQVTAINAKKNYAVATVEIENRFMPVYKDAHAIVRPKNLLGETYVEIERGTPSAGEIQGGDTIPLANTITPVQVDEVLNALDPNTRQKLGIVINALGEASAARGKDLNLSTQDFRRITAALATTSTTLNSEKDNIDALIVQLDLLQKTAADYHEELAQVLRDWSDTSRTMAAHSQNFANAIEHLGNVLGDLDAGLTPNTPALTAAVARLPATADHASDFLGVSSSLMELFLNPVNGGTKGQGPAIDDAVALFPRLAQVMIGVNSCDAHIYANGYVNVPGVTEPRTCQSPLNPDGRTAANPTLSGEIFTNQVMGNPAMYGKVHADRHLWRVMDQLDASGGANNTGSTSCGLFTDPAGKPTPNCYPGTTGTENYAPPAGTANSSATNAAPRVAPASGGRSIWSNIWNLFVGSDSNA